MVLRTVNMLGEKYTDLEDLRYGLEPSMSESELTHGVFLEPVYVVFHLVLTVDRPL